mmetsp:Transcript_23419/g.61131  ORF Transcript_23419/g.61131 Transcript_23419/m.61131 type:complete len:202 (+) Transcript_23419:1664-2269(+)
MIVWSVGQAFFSPATLSTFFLLVTTVVILDALMASPTASIPRVAYEVATTNDCERAPNAQVIQSAHVSSNNRMVCGPVKSSTFFPLGTGCMPQPFLARVATSAAPNASAFVLSSRKDIHVVAPNFFLGKRQPGSVYSPRKVRVPMAFSSPYLAAAQAKSFGVVSTAAPPSLSGTGDVNNLSTAARFLRTAGPTSTEYEGWR